MNSPAVDIAYLLSLSPLISANLITISRVPSSPDKVLVVSCSTSREPQSVTSSTDDFSRIDKPNVQVYIRATAGQNEEGYELAEAVKNLLHGKRAFSVNDTQYHSIYALSDIAEIGVDEKLRPVFSINFRIERSKT